MDTVSLSLTQRGQGVTLATHPHVAPRLRESKVEHLFLLCAYTACYVEAFAFTFSTVGGHRPKQAKFHTRKEQLNTIFPPLLKKGTRNYDIA